MTVSTGNITAGNLLLSGAIVDSAQLDIQTSAANANIVLTPNGTGNVNTGANVSVTGNITGGNVLGGANVNATTHTGTTVSVSGNITGGNLITSAAVSAASVSASGNITGGNLTVSTGNITGGNIVNANGNGVGNIGSSSVYFNTVFAKATSAQYADLAENYEADNNYEPGTVVVFGGDKQVTVTTEAGDERVAGAVSTQPAHLMNAGMSGIPVALRGQVPVKVIGPVVKGDSLVTSAQEGFAQSVGRDRSYAQAVFAKSVETNLAPGNKIIIAVIL